MGSGSTTLPSEGQVEIFDNGVWGSFCADGWDLNDARVVCRQLGFPDAVEATNSTLMGNGSLAQLTNVQCNGSEEHLRVECPFSEMKAGQNCSHGEAGVVCQGTLMGADILDNAIMSRYETGLIYTHVRLQTTCTYMPLGIVYDYGPWVHIQNYTMHIYVLLIKV